MEPPILIWITWSYLLITKIPHPLPPSTTIPVTWSNISSSSTSWQSNSIQYLHLLSFSDFENAFWEIFEIVSYSGLLLDRNPFPKKPYKENRNEFLKILHLNINFFFSISLLRFRNWKCIWRGGKLVKWRCSHNQKVEITSEYPTCSECQPPCRKSLSFLNFRLRFFSSPPPFLFFLHSHTAHMI